MNIFLVSQAVGNTYLIRTQGGDNACYRVNTKGELEKAYTFDFGKRGIPDTYGMLKGDLMLQDYMRADYYKMPIYLCEGGKFFYFTSCGLRQRRIIFFMPGVRIRGFIGKRIPIWKFIFSRQMRTIFTRF